MIWIIIAIIVFAIIILIHEFWHFYAARKFWVKVEEFWLWLPPRAKKIFKDKKWTIYSLNWIPFGGFVKITWEMPLFLRIYDENKKILTKEKIIEKIKNNKKIFDKNWVEIPKKEQLDILEKIKEEKAPYNLINKPAWQQSIILLAWIFMNFVLAFFIFTILFFVWVKPIWVNNVIKTDLDIKLLPTQKQALKNWIIKKYDWVLLFPIKDSLASTKWIKQFDYLIKINNQIIKNPEDVIKKIKNSKNKKLNFTIKRIEKLSKKEELKKIKKNEDFEKLIENLKNSKNIKNIEIKIPKNWKIWVYLDNFITRNKNFEYKYSLINSIKYWFKETINQTIFTFQALKEFSKKIFTPKNKLERKEAIDSMSWPVWIVNFIKDTSYKWIWFILILTAIISINLWVMNLLPIPALDWWRFFIVLINSISNKIFRKKLVPVYTEAILHSFFFIILLWLIFFITYNDIEKIIK